MAVMNGVGVLGGGQMDNQSERYCIDINRNGARAEPRSAPTP